MNFPERMDRALRFATAPCVSSFDVDMVPETYGLAGPAIALCDTCPVRDDCRADFLATHAADSRTFGVYAGTFVPPAGHRERRAAIERIRLGTDEDNDACPRGHKWTEESMYCRERKDGSISRQCRTCKAEDALRRWAARREMAVPA